MIAVIAMHAKLAPMGWTGVWLFFVISGYVVTLSIQRERVTERAAVRFGRFFARRIARIVPAYYLYIGAGLLTAVVAAHSIAGATYASLFGFYHNIAMERGFGELAYWPVGHLWTVAVEMQFYVVYGAIAYFAPVRVTRAVLVCFLVAAPLARWLTGAALAHLDPEAAAYIIYSAPGLHFDSFAWGCLLAMAQMSRPIERLATPLALAGAAAIGLYLSAYMAVNYLVLHRHGTDIVRDIISGIMYGQGREVFAYTALGLGFLGLVALTAARSKLVQPVTGLAGLQWIGRISYGCYIYHALCLHVISSAVTGHWEVSKDLPVAGRIIVFALTLPLTLAIAQLSFRYVEQPAAALIGRWGKPAKAASAAPN